MPETELARYLTIQPDEDLAEFHRKSSTTGFSDDEVARATSVLTDCFEKIEAALSDHAWIVGEAFSLADVAWIPLQFTLVGASFDFSPYPKINAWVEAIRERPSFKSGVLAWCEKF